MFVLITDNVHLQWDASSWLRAPYAALCSIFGGPGETQLDLGNYHHAWLLKATNREDWTFLVHDSRGDGSREQNRGDTRYVWHVHGPNDAALRQFCGWLSHRVVAYWSEQPRVKRLTASSLLRVQELVQEGHSMPDAMARAAEWEALPDAVDFDWPPAE